MFKNNFRTILLSAALATSANVYAASNYDNDYDSTLYQDEGRLLLKFRASSLNASGKMKNPAPTSLLGKAEPRKSGKMLASGVGAEAAAVLFFSDRIATEISLGLSSFKHKAAPIDAAVWNYGQNGSAKKRARIYMIPMSIGMQYHIAPFGGIRPYVGAGYQYVYAHTSSKNFTATNGYGPLAQFGVDFVLRDDTIFNIDLKQSFYKTKIKYKRNMLGLAAGDSAPSSKVTINPIQLSVGLGIKF